jgi:hypothetical protein
MKNVYLLLSVLLSSTYVFSQNGGQSIFNFLNHPNSARITALGGNAIATKDQDIALAWTNPAVLDKNSSGQVAINYDLLFQGVGAGYLGYAKHIEKIGMTFHGGIQYMNYGTFQSTNEFGATEGTFDAKDIAIGFGAAKPLSEHWSLGLNAKFISSTLETYSATGFCTDVSGMYYSPEKRVGFTILAKNMGAQLGTYTGGSRAPLPFDIQIGFSKRLKHLPFQFSFVAKDLTRWDVTYKDPNVKEVTSIFGETTKKTPVILTQLDNFARHLGVNGEFFLGKKENLRLRFGYSHLLKKELSVAPFRSLTGFSFGVGFKVSKFKIDFGRNIEHLAGGFTHFGLAVNLNEFRKKV